MSGALEPPANQISIDSSNTSAFRVFDANSSTDYINIDTSTEQIELGNATDNPSFLFQGSGNTNFEDSKIGLGGVFTPTAALELASGGSTDIQINDNIVRFDNGATATLKMLPANGNSGLGIDSQGDMVISADINISLFIESGGADISLTSTSGDINLSGATIAITGDVTITGDLAVAGVDKVNLAIGAISGKQSGLEVTINVGDNTKVDVAAGVGIITDWAVPTAPVYTKISFAGATAFTLTNIATDPFTTLFIDSSGVLQQKAGASLTPQEKRQNIGLDAAVHPDFATVTSIASNAIYSYQSQNAILDYIGQIGAINQGNRMDAGGANLTVQKSAGTTSLPWINHSNDLQNPSILTNGTQNPLSPWLAAFRDGVGGFTFQVGLTATDPTLFDDGSGVLAPLANNNKWSIKRYYFFGQNQSTSETYGQAEYNSQAEAEANIFTENPEVSPLFAGGTLVSVLLVRKNATDLQDISQAKFIDIITQTSAAAGGAGTQDLQSTYDFSTDPEILTDSTRQAFTVRRGTAADTDNIYEGQNGAGSITSSIKGDGQADFNTKLTLTAPSNAEITATETGGATMRISGHGGAGIVSTGSNHPIDFATNGFGTQMSLETNGEFRVFNSVKIGADSSPAESLDVLGNVIVSDTSIGSDVFIALSNADNTNSASHAVLTVKNGGASGGDAKIGLSVTGVTDWALGVDNSIDDRFTISQNSLLGTNDYFTIDKTSGDINIPNNLAVGSGDLPDRPLVVKVESASLGFRLTDETDSFFIDFDAANDRAILSFSDGVHQLWLKNSTTSTGTILIGDNDTASTAKVGYLSMLGEDLGHIPTLIIGGNMTAADNIVFIGGDDGGVFAGATEIQFRTSSAQSFVGALGMTLKGDKDLLLERNIIIKNTFLESMVADAAIAIGEVLTYSGSTDNRVIRTTSQANPKFAGVAVTAAAGAGDPLLVATGGLMTVKSQGSVSRLQYARSGSNAGAADSTGSPGVGSFGIWMEAGSGGALLLCRRKIAELF